jgi:hypothetical protein
MKKKVILFNLVEILCVYLSGLLFRLSNTTIFIIMFVFVLARMTFGKTLHYKSPYKCFIATLTIFLSLFVVCKVNIYLSILISIFDGFVLTGKANIEDMFLWSGKVSKYQDIMDFVKYNPEKMVDFEDRLEKQDNLDYLIYKYRFKENLTFDKISKLLDIDSPRISEKQDKIALAIRMTFKI